MDAVKRYYGIVKASSSLDRPDYTYYIARKGTRPVVPGSACKICALFDAFGLFVEVETSEAGNRYQRVSSQSSIQC